MTWRPVAEFEKFITSHLLKAKDDHLLYKFLESLKYRFYQVLVSGIENILQTLDSKELISKYPLSVYSVISYIKRLILSQEDQSEESTPLIEFVISDEYDSFLAKWVTKYTENLTQIKNEIHDSIQSKPKHKSLSKLHEKSVKNFTKFHFDAYVSKIWLLLDLPDGLDLYNI